MNFQISLVHWGRFLIRVTVFDHSEESDGCDQRAQELLQNDGKQWSGRTDTRLQRRSVLSEHAIGG